MKILFDLFPVILFFIAFKFSEQSPEAAAALLGQLPGLDSVKPDLAPVLLATAVVILATLLQVAWVYFRHGKVHKLLWFSLVLVVVMGGLTLKFQNPIFIKWKPTLLYWGFAVGMTTAVLVFKKNPARSMLGNELQLPEPVWNRVNWSWIAFLLFMGAANLFVAFTFSTEAWVNFKVFGGMGLMFAFMVAQGVALSKYIEEEKK